MADMDVAYSREDLERQIRVAKPGEQIKYTSDVPLSKIEWSSFLSDVQTLMAVTLDFDPPRDGDKEIVLTMGEDPPNVYD
jgi:hypothetical protein